MKGREVAAVVVTNNYGLGPTVANHVADVVARLARAANEGLSMNPLRKPSARNDGLVVSYDDEVTEDQVRKIDDLVREEFECGEWVTVEAES
jgi:hypothetical protein